MSKLSASDLISRREFDFRVVSLMSKGSRIYTFTAHRTAQDAENGKRAIENERDARYAIHYRCVYRIKTLIDAAKYSDCTTIRIDASDANYPFASPSAWVVKGCKLPWSPHFAPNLPVCLGSVWKSNGKVLLAHLLIHLARLLNWDEDLSREYGGYNPAAVKWWRAHLGRPINPELVYPVLPSEELYALDSSARGGFRSVVQAPSGMGGGFRKLS